MVKYKNTSRASKTFHGVTFKPGETKEVSGWINDTCMIRVDNETVVSGKKPAVASKKSATSDAKSSDRSDSSLKTNKEEK